jgi:leader peptidase (prepilin peptidase) / N-methyltransferase
VATGTVLRGIVLELSVPSGAPHRTACPRCTAPVHAVFPVLCSSCRHLLGPSLVLELATATIMALLVGRFGGHPEVLAFCFLGALGVALAAIDISVQRLPDQLTLPAYPILITLLGVSAIGDHNGTALMRALLGGVVLTCAFLLLALLRPGQLGGGDVKLAGLAGLALAWLGWPTLLLGTFLGFFLFALVSVAMLAARRITLHGAMCFGPFLIGGTLMAILANGH